MIVTSLPCEAHLLDTFHRPHRCLDLGAVGVGLDDDHVAADRSLQRVGCVLGDDAAVVDDADAVRELVRLLEVLRREEDGHAELGVERAHLFPHRGPADRIEAGRRLVEEQHLGVVHECGGQIEPALHAAAVGGDEPVERVADVDEASEVGDAPVDLVRTQPVQPALQAEELATGLPLVERGLLQRDADAQPYLLGLSGDVVAGDGRDVRRSGSAACTACARPSTCRRRSGRGSRRSRPSATSRSTPSTARLSPNVRTRPCARMAGASSSAPAQPTGTSPSLEQLHEPGLVEDRHAELFGLRELRRARALGRRRPRSSSSTPSPATCRLAR